MSARRAPSAAAGGGVRAALAAVLVLGFAAALMLLIAARPAAEPFDPRSGATSGTRGLVLLLRKYGAEVSIGRDVPTSGSGRRLLVLQDRLDDTQREQVAAFAAAGGIVVVADGESPLAPGPLSTAPQAEGSLGFDVALGTCDIPALAHLTDVQRTDGRSLPVTGGASGCFGSGVRAFVVASPRGAGVVVTLADNRILTNGMLRYGDNAALATALLAPGTGAPVSIVLGSGAAKTAADIGTGERTLSDLVRPGVWMALTQLGLAFVALALARGIRVGRPVREPEQVLVAGSELAHATGRLMQRAGHAGRAADVLRESMRRDLCSRYRLPVTVSDEELDAVHVDRTGDPPGTVLHALRTPVGAPDALLDLSRRIHSIRTPEAQGDHS